ncbi:peptidoglycan-binding protein [Reyranella sp.]|uniref:peptidoglycan-binding protein n=1 Tax=Reyranella sp. TaxID=1929291 RepID=UPI003BAD7BA7
MKRAHLTIVLLCLACACFGASAARAEPLRLALIMSNAAYPSLGELARCPPAAATVRDALKARGFEVIERRDLGRGEFDGAIGLISRRAAAAPGSIVVFYFCGYAVGFNSRTFLLPTSATLARDHDVLSQGVIVKSVVASLQRARDGAGLLLLDLFTPANPALPGPARLDGQFDPSPFAVVAAGHDQASGRGATAVALGLRDALAGGDTRIGELVGHLRARLVRDGLDAQIVAATGDAALVPEAERAPERAAERPTPRPAEPERAPPPASAPPARSEATAPPPPPPPPPAPAMVDEDRMSERQRRQVQMALAAIGYYGGGIDGVFGPETRAAIRRFQFEIKAELTGHLNAEQAGRLMERAR